MCCRRYKKNVYTIVVQDSYRLHFKEKSGNLPHKTYMYVTCTILIIKIHFVGNDINAFIHTNSNFGKR